MKDELKESQYQGIKCGDSIYFKTEIEIFQQPFDIPPPSKDLINHDIESCPECQKNIKHYTDMYQKRFNGFQGKRPFPQCCKGHIALSKNNYFNIEIYTRVPFMVGRKIQYTNALVSHLPINDLYFKIVTDYIEWAIESFGTHPSSLGEPLYLSGYLEQLVYLIKINARLDKELREKLTEYVDLHLNMFRNNSSLEVASKSKIKIPELLKIYNGWLELFPFHFSYFSDLKEKFNKIVPFISKDSDKNFFTDQIKFKPHTEKSMLSVLASITEKLIFEINTSTLYEKGALSKHEDYRIKLLIEERKVSLSKYNKEISTKLKPFRKMLKSWFKDEIKFANELNKLLAENPKQEIKNTVETKNDDIGSGKFNFEKELQDIINEYKENPFDKAFPLKNMIELLNKFTQSKNKKGHPFLSQTKFIDFIKKGILKDKLAPKVKFDYSRGEKGALIKQFYNIYEHGSREYASTKTKDDYIEMIISCNDNKWEAKDIRTLFKKDKVKKSI